MHVGEEVGVVILVAVVSGLFGSRGVSGMFSACRVGVEIS